MLTYLKIRFIAFLFCWLPIFLSSAQVIEFKGFNLSEEFLNRYPFVANKFYQVNFELSDSSAGYFVLLFDKAILINGSNAKVRDTTEMLLRNNRFYQDDCWYNLTCDGDYTRKVQGHRFNVVSENSSVTNFQTLDLNNYYNLSGHVKTYTKVTKIKWYLFGSRVCEEGGQRVSGDFPLVNINYTNSLWFTLNDAHQIQMNSSILMKADVLYDGCNKPWSSPYTSRQSMEFPVVRSSVLGFEEGTTANELLTILTANTKRINITQDEKYYYVYCIK